MREHLALSIVVLVVLVELSAIFRIGQARIWRAGARGQRTQLVWSLAALSLGAVNLGVVDSLTWWTDRRAGLVAAALPAFGALLLQHELMLLRTLEPLTSREHQAGRRGVLDVAHGALSTNLRLLEQRAEQHRSDDPGLAGLAVTVNSRLREILALGDAGLTTSEAPMSLRGPIQTLVRAYGANAIVTIKVRRLTEVEHDRMLMALTRLVSSALEAGAETVRVSVVSRAGHVVLLVADDSAVKPEDRPDQEATRAALAQQGISTSHDLAAGLVQRTAVMPRDG